MKLGIKLRMAAVGIMASCLALAGCSTQPPDKNAGIVPTAKRIALDEVDARGSLVVTSLDLPLGQPIAEEFSNYGANKAPRLNVSGYPEKTASFVLLMEDPDAPDGPYVHWVVYDMSLNDVAAGKVPPANAAMGANSAGTSAYFGPRPPQGDKPHRYHFQVFALNKSLNLKPGATRDEVVNAFRNNVLAKGELVATYGKK